MAIVSGPRWPPYFHTAHAPSDEHEASSSLEFIRPDDVLIVVLNLVRELEEKGEGLWVL